MTSPHSSSTANLKALPRSARSLPAKILLLPDDNSVQRNNS
jgi:hypothetical protein